LKDGIMLLPDGVEYLSGCASYFNSSTFTNSTVSIAQTDVAVDVCAKNTASQHTNLFFLFSYVVFAGCHEVRSNGIFVQACKPASVFEFGIPQ